MPSSRAALLAPRDAIPEREALLMMGSAGFCFCFAGWKPAVRR
jgi:hypothetical protein